MSVYHEGYRLITDGMGDEGRVSPLISDSLQLGWGSKRPQLLDLIACVLVIVSWIAVGVLVAPVVLIVCVLVVAMRKSPSKCSRLNSVPTARKSESRRSPIPSRTDIGDNMCARCRLNPKLCSCPNQSNDVNPHRSLIVVLPA